MRFVYCRGYSDYYSNAKGGHDLGRGIEPVPFDGRVLGEWLEKLQPGLAQSLGLAVMTNEARSLSHYNRSLGAFAVSARVVLRTYAARLRRQALLTNGASLIAQMLHDRARPRDPDLDRGAARGAHRRGRPRRRRPHRPRRRSGARSGPARACCWPPAASPTTPRCASSSAATSRTGPAGRSRTRATPARCIPRRCASAQRPTSWTRPGGSPRPGRAGSASRPSTRPASARARSTSTRPASAS